MSDSPKNVTSLPLSQKFSRLRVRLRNPEWRRYGKILLAGKGIGVGLVLLVIGVTSIFIGGHAFAADPDLKGNDIVNPINTVWGLVAAFLGFGMQVGFTMLEAGFCRSCETVNVLMECVVDTCLCGILFYAIGFAFMFSHGNGFIGYHWFFLQGAPATYETTGVAFLAVWIFQFAFADTCSTIPSGAMIGRTGFVGDLVYSVGVSGFIYPIIGHWAWGPDGFLAAMGSAGNFLPWVGTGFHDFAGSTVVHTIGGFIALAGAIVLGPRLGRKFKRDRGAPMLPHHLTIAACAAGLTAMSYAYFLSKKWDAGFTVNGFLAGLVAITCPCYWVSPVGAILLGGIAGVLVVLGVEALEWLRIDDPIGAVPVHGFCGIWGTLSLGLFACGKYGSTGPIAPDNSAALTGLFYGGGTRVLVAQAIGSASITITTFAVSMVVMLAVNAIGLLRVSEEGETYGLDLHEHGISAYPEYVISALGAPGGMSQELPH